MSAGRNKQVNGIWLLHVHSRSMSIASLYVYNYNIHFGRPPVHRSILSQHNEDKQILTQMWCVLLLHNDFELCSFSLLVLFCCLAPFIYPIGCYPQCSIPNPRQGSLNRDQELHFWCIVKEVVCACCQCTHEQRNHAPCHPLPPGIACTQTRLTFHSIP